MYHKSCQVFFLVWICACSVTATGQDATTEARGEEAEIEKAIQSYTAAFNARDVEKLVSHWSPDGVYISRTSGEQIVGREAMTAEFTAVFEGDSVPKLVVATESIDFISPNVALERGTAKVTHSEDDVVETNYSVVYVKRDGAWLIDRVTEDEIVVDYSNQERLKGLDWLIGEWVDEIGGVTIEMACRWTRNQNFISRTFTVSDGDQVESSGLQVIGWDPTNNQIRSWLFDSDGGVVTGTWTHRDDKWIVQSIATLADGAQGSFTSVFRPLDDGTFTWQKINQIVDGRLLPSLDETVVHRK